MATFFLTDLNSKLSLASCCICRCANALSSRASRRGPLYTLPRVYFQALRSGDFSTEMKGPCAAPPTEVSHGRRRCRRPQIIKNVDNQNVQPPPPACISLNKYCPMKCWNDSSCFQARAKHSVFLFLDDVLIVFAGNIHANDTMSSCALALDSPPYVIPTGQMWKQLGEVSYILNEVFTRFRPWVWEKSLSNVLRVF